jgi:iron complex transport system permease protein
MAAMRGARWALLAVVVAAGSVWLGPGDLSDPELGTTFLRLRLLRGGGAALAGACLAVAGVLAQALFRNPLASPSVLGATAGASFGGQLTLLFLRQWQDALQPEILVPLGCFAGALVALVALLAFARRDRDRLSLILVGFVLSAVFLALGSFATSLAQEQWEVGRAVVAFSLGGVGGVGPLQLGLALPLAAAGMVTAGFGVRILDLLLTGEDEARSLGIDVDDVARWSAVWIAVLVGAAVSLSGNLGFVGLIVPHAGRQLVGPSHRALVPLAAVIGAAFVMSCDGVVRGLPTRSEVPLGVVTSLVGAPVFIHLLRVRRELS